MGQIKIVHPWKGNVGRGSLPSSIRALLLVTKFVVKMNNWRMLIFKLKRSCLPSRLVGKNSSSSTTLCGSTNLEDITYSQVPSVGRWRIRWLPSWLHYPELILISQERSLSSPRMMQWSSGCDSKCLMALYDDSGWE